MENTVGKIEERVCLSVEFESVAHLCAAYCSAGFDISRNGLLSTMFGPFRLLFRSIWVTVCREVWEEGAPSVVA